MMTMLLLPVLLLLSGWGIDAAPLTDEQLSRLYALKHPNTETEENAEYFQGDIVLMDGELPEPGQLNAMWDLNRRWEGGIIPYTITGDYTTDQRDRILAGIADLVAKTMVNGQKCIDIVPRTSHPNYVFVEKYSGCSAPVGRYSGAQRISLSDGCYSHGTIMHEFLHSFGYFHEHQRADRDEYITVHYDNIQPDFAYAFDKLVEGVSVDHMGTAYDYGSVMHYHAYGFAIDSSKPTITPTDPNAEIGQREQLSQLDIERVQIFYCCLNAEDSKYHKHLAGELRDYCVNFP